MNTINLEQILRNKLMGKPFSQSLIIDAMREACEATVDMCEKAYLEPNGQSDGIKIIYTPTLTKIRKVKNQIV